MNSTLGWRWTLQLHRALTVTPLIVEPALEPQLNALPLHRDGKRDWTTLILGLVFLIPLLIVCGAIVSRPGHLSLLKLVGQAPMIFVGPILFGAPAFIALRRRSALDIDQAGVRVTINGKVSNYPWGEIAEVSILSGRNVANFIRIQRKGELFNNPEPNLIRPEFGFGPAELVGIIKAGVRQWGDAEATAAGPQPTSSTQGVGFTQDATVKAYGGRLRRSIGLIILLFLGADGLMSSMMLRYYVDDEILKARGVETVGVVTGRYITTSKSSTSHHVVYTFALPDGAVGHGDNVAPHDVDSMLSLGGSVPIIYDPKHPKRSDLNFNDRAHKRDLSFFLWCVLVVNVFFLGMGGFMIWAVISAFKRAIRDVEAEAANARNGSGAAAAA